MKTRVDFQKLVSGHCYSIEKQLLILEWMLFSGSPYSKYNGRWDKSGVDQLFFWL